MRCIVTKAFSFLQGRHDKLNLTIVEIPTSFLEVSYASVYKHRAFELAPEEKTLVHLRRCADECYIDSIPSGN